MGSSERRFAREELELDFDCCVSAKARRKERRLADFRPPASLIGVIPHLTT